MPFHSEALEIAIKRGGFSKWMRVMRITTTRILEEYEGIKLKNLNDYLYDDFQNN